MVDVRKFSNIDLYKLLKVGSTATESEIRRAYRKRALLCHPDKNPNNPKAAEQFHQLSDALKVLCDRSLRDEYDRMKINEKLKQQGDQIFKDFEEMFGKFHTATEQPKTSNSSQRKTPKDQDEIDRLRKEKAQLRAKQKLQNKRKKLIKDVQLAYTKSIANLKRAEAALFKTMGRFDPKLFVDIGPAYVKVVDDIKAKHAKSIDKLKRTNVELIEDFAESIEHLKGFNTN